MQNVVSVAFLCLLAWIMPATISHALSATTPDDPAYEIRPSHWNSAHIATVNAVGSEVIGAFSNSNGLSFGLEAGGAITGSYTVPSVPAQTAFVFSNSNGVSFGTNGSTVTATVQTNYLTTAMASNRGTDFVQATAAFAGTSASGTINSTGISVSIGPYITTGALSGDTSKYVQNWKLTGNTAGTTSSAQGTDLWLAGGQGITVSGSSNTISFSVGSYITTAMASNRGTDFVQATAAFAGTNASGTINSTGISVSVAAAGAGPTISSYANMAADGLQNVQTQGLGNLTSVAVAFQLPNAISASFLRIPIAHNTASTAIASTASSANASGEIYTTWNAVVYSMGSGASSKSLMSEASGSHGQTFRNSVSIAANGSQYSITQALSFRAEGGLTTSSTQYSVSSSVLPLSTTFFSAAFSGSKWLDIDFANSLKAGPKWLVFGRSTTVGTNSTRFTALTNCRCDYANHYAASMVSAWWGVMGSTDHTSGGLLGGGSFATAGGGTTANLPISAISSSASNNIPYFQLLRSA